jgi:glutamyl-tRNA reductase
MQILCLGISHRSAPLEVRERFAVPGSRAEPRGAHLARTPGVSEAVIVSTCNRVEYYVAAEEPLEGSAAVEDFIGAAAMGRRVTLFARLQTAQSIRTSSASCPDSSRWCSARPRSRAR